MSKNFIFITLAVTSLFLGMIACEFSASTANIKDSWLSFDEEGEQPTEVFGSEDVFYAQVLLANAPDDTIVKAAWIAVEVETGETNFPLDESEITTGEIDLHFELSNDMLWPNGQYKVDIYLNDELDRSLEFTVQ